MGSQCRVIVKRIWFEELTACPFRESVGIRELARQTGLDPTYLSKVRRGLLPVTEENLRKIVDAQQVTT